MSSLEARETPREPFLFCAICEQQDAQYKMIKIKLAISIMAITPATASTNACVAAWRPTLSVFMAKVRSKKWWLL
jgi:hypothetical protein